MATYGTIATNSTGYTWTLGTGERPADPPSGLIVTRAVQTRKGWRGQVIIDREIIHETKNYNGEDAKEDAVQAVNRYVVNRLKQLFAPPAARNSDEDDADA